MSTTSDTFARMVGRIRKWAGAAEADRLADQELLRRYVRSNDEAAFACLVRRHGPLVLGLCRRILRHEQDAEDAFQATFLVLARKARAIRRRQAVGSWLCGVAFRVATKLRASQARRQAREGPLGDEAPAATAEDWTWREVQTVVYAELDKLADKYRAPLLLCCVQGRTRDEAARQLGWGLGVLRGRLDRGRELLRARLVRRGLSLAAAPLALGLAGQASAAPAIPLALLSSTVKAALVAAPTTAAAGIISPQAAALAQGVLQAMFLNKVKSLAVGLVALALVGGGVGLVSQRTSAQSGGPSASAAAQDRPASGRRAGGETDVRKLQEEVERLRRELEQTRSELLAALRENVALRARTQVATTPDNRPPVYLNQFVTGPKAGEKKLVRPLQTQVISPDGKRMAVATKGGIDLVDMARGQILARVLLDVGPVSGLAFSPDGKILAGGVHDSVRLWDAATLREIRRFSLPNPVTGVAFSRDGRDLDIQEADGTHHEFDLATGKELRVRKGH
jgi:RNA polymerase sigma factor (sigma-70 family)